MEKELMRDLAVVLAWMLLMLVAMGGSAWAGALRVPAALLI